MNSKKLNGASEEKPKDWMIENSDFLELFKTFCSSEPQAKELEPLLIRVLLYHPEWYMRMRAAISLGYGVGSKKAISALHKALNDPSSMVKGFAQHSLVKNGISALEENVENDYFYN